MDKNTCLYIVLGFLLLCIFLSLDKKEGFVMINEGAFRTQCGVGHQSCIVNISGARGFPCPINGDNTNYNIVGADQSPYQMPVSSGQGEGPTIFSSLFDNISLDPDTPCNEAVAYQDGDNPSIGPCTSSENPFRLSGCSSKCMAPPAEDFPDYDITDRDIKIIPGTPQDETSINCAAGYRHAKNVCFDKTTGNITGQPESACTLPDNVWYGDGSDDEQPVQISCNQSGATFVPIGCEPLCQSRVTDPTQYIISENELPVDYSDSASFRNLYNQNKELMQITSNRPDGNTPGDPEIPINIITNSPYNVQEDGVLDPINFNVIVAPGSSQDSGDQSISFGGDGEAFACNPNDENEERGSKYYVSGLFPTCSPDNEECLNFNITYTPDEYNSDNNPPPFNLEKLRENLPTEDIFQGNPREEDIQKYRDSLYYFRGFKDSDGNYNVEGQIRCDTDQNSRYGCAIIDEAENIYNKYFKTASGTRLYSDNNNLYSRFFPFGRAIVTRDPRTDSKIFSREISDNVQPAPKYLIQKNSFCYTRTGTNISSQLRNSPPRGKVFTPGINWENQNDQNIKDSLKDALDACDSTEGEDRPCKYITHEKERNKYYIHPHNNDSYYGPDHIAIHKDYNCIFRPEQTAGDAMPGFSGSYLIDATVNRDYIGYKNADCMSRYVTTEELDIPGSNDDPNRQTLCNRNPNCYGYQKTNDVITFFQKYSGQMTSPDDNTNGECYLKNSAKTSDFVEMNLGGNIWQSARSLVDYWMTDDKKAPLQSYVLKTKNEIKTFITGG